MMWRKVNKIFGVVACVLILTGCGVPDKALVLTGDNSTESTGNVEEDSSSGSSLQSGSGKDVVHEMRADEEEDYGEQMILVYVCGAVQNPGVVELPADSRATDALEAAGGLLAEAQPDYVNLAARLEDAQKLYFPTREEAGHLIQEEAAATSGLVNINTAGVEMLCTLPGIGEARAGDIVAYREQNGDFQSKEDIMKVSGIKQSAYDKLQNWITVE